jgi:hypothetical protein
MIGDGNTRDDIDHAYRELANECSNRSRDRGYEKMRNLRKQYGRTEATVLAWLEAENTESDMDSKYRLNVTRYGCKERAAGYTRGSRAQKVTSITLWNTY